MGKNKKHSKNKATARAQSTQNQGSSSATKISGKKEAATFVEIHGEDEVSPEIKSLNTTKEDSDVSQTIESDMFEKTFGRKNFEANDGNNKPSSYNNRPKESRSFSPTKSSRNFSHKRWSEPMETGTEFDDKRKSIQNVTERERRQNYTRGDSDIPRDRMRNERKSTEFETYEKEFKRNLRTIYVRTIEIEHDLFRMPKEYSLGHCVAEDMNMGSGIAVRFRHEFQRVGELLNQRARTGGLAVLKDDDRFVYYLVTKRLSTGKPTYETLFASLQKMREHIVENNVEKLALPRIGCGLDRLCWDNVKFMIEFIFREIDIEIKICNLQIEDSPQLRHKNCKLTNVLYPIQDIEEGTIIVYLSSEDGFISDEMKMLDEKFFFLTEFRFAVKTKGNVIFFNKNENYLLCGCIVKQTEAESVDFISLQKCLNNIQKESRKYQFGYIGFQAIKDDDCNSKIINLLRNSLRDVEVYVCWPGDLYNMMPRDRYSDYTPRTSLEQEKGPQSFNQCSLKQDSWRSPSQSIYNSKVYDIKREKASTSILTDVDWSKQSDSKKSKSNENNSIRIPEKTDSCMAEQKNRVLHLKSGLHQMKEKSIIIYWASEDGHLSHEMNSLCRKFKFFEEFDKSKKQLGNVIKYKHNDDYVLYGCIVRRVYTDPINFQALQQCLIEVNERKKTEMLDIVGIQAIKDQDETLNFKIINALINTLQDVTLKVCWPGDLKQKMPKYK